jgi:sortase A
MRFSRGQHTRRRSRRSRPTGRLIVASAGALSICAGTAIAAQLGLFFFHSSRAGGDLIGREQQAIARAAGSPSACQDTHGRAAGGAAASAARQAPGPVGSGGQQPDGLLEAPVLGLVAPVVEGTGDAVLDDAVGHDPESAWPGGQGTSVLSAHDVTWFSHIGQLKPGDEIRYVTPCRTATYKVTSHAIVKAGTPVYDTGAARLVLDTCYPLNALYITATRYLLYATLVGTAPTHALTVAPQSWRPPAVPAPAALAAQGLSLADNSAPLGTLRLTGSPAPAWAQSSAPLDFQAAALAAYFGIVRSAAQEKSTWWADLAPAVPVAAAKTLWGGRLSYDSALTVTLRAEGTRAASAKLTATVTATRPDIAGRYDLTVGETVKDGKLHVTQVQLKTIAQWSPAAPAAARSTSAPTRSPDPAVSGSRTGNADLLQYVGP